MKVPFNVYDFFSIIFPGALFILILNYEHDIFSFQTVNNIVDYSILLLLIYIIGDLISIITRNAERKFSDIKNYINKHTDKKHSTVLRGRVSNINFSEEVNAEILKSINEYYDLEIDRNNKDLFNLAYSAVPDKMGKRDLFLAKANMMRSLSYLAVFYSIYLIGKIIYLLCSAQLSYMNFFLLILSVFLWKTFRTSFIYFQKLSDEIPFMTFLSWYKKRTNNRS